MLRICGKHLILILITAVCLPAWGSDTVRFQPYQSEDPYEDVMENIKDAIIGRGLNISNVLPAAEMLHRTGADLGYPKDVFSRAETIEFCSASLSHQLVAANPANIVLCPFTISVYALTGDDKLVYVSYRTPLAGSETRPITDKVEKLIQGIIQEALE